ncbi:MAG: histone deacetylase [Anaerolineales bacterium]
MDVYYHDLFTFPLPPKHRFPIQKYKLLRQRLVSEGIIPVGDLHIPEPASDEQLMMVHTRGYLQQIEQGELTDKEIRRMGFPWSPDLVERSRRSVGSTIAACRSAIKDGIAVNLAGGTHHAYPDHGQGFCVFNDVAVAVKVVQREKRADRILIVDCDVHQGNGTAAIFKDEPRVFALSIHGAKNFPFHKEKSDLDIPLPDGTEDKEYLKALEKGLSEAIKRFSADLAIYLAGADPHQRDRLGRLSLTKEGLDRRDRLVLGRCRQEGLPVVVVMSGGYGEDVRDTIDIHFQTVRFAAEMTRNSVE